MPWCYLIAAFFAAVALVFGVMDIYYFIRMGLCVLFSRYFRKKIHILDTTEITAFCLINDIDTLITHMNNARYLREVDFARADFYERTTLYTTIRSKGGAVVQGGTTIRYRRFIRPFSRFTITSKIMYWDDQSIYMEHRFVSPSDKFVHCIVMCKQRVTSCSVNDVLNEILNRNANKADVNNPQKSVENGNGTTGGAGGGIFDASKIRPELPLEVAKWIECNDISSVNIRNGC